MIEFDIKRILSSPLAVLIYLSLLKLLFPLLTSADFEFHRDEFLYMAMGDHPALGYLEVPPFIAMVAKLTKILLGESLYAMRFFPSLAGVFTLLLTGLIAKEFGGGSFAQIFSAVAYLLALVYLRMNLFLMPVSFDLFFFVLAVYLLIRIFRNNRPRLWILLGIVTGVGLLNKYTMLLFGFGAFISILFTSHRNLLKDNWPYISAGIALLIWSPNLLWQIQNDLPFFDHMRILAERQLSNVNPVNFLLTQVLMNLYAAPVWIAGLFYLLFGKQLRTYRGLGWMYMSLLGLMLLLGGKVYYLAPAYPMLIAAGAVACEYFVWRINWHWLKPVFFTILIVGNISLIPIGIPLLSVDQMIKYFDFGSKYMGIGEALRWETGQMHELPQDYADMLGWEQMVSTVAKTYHSLPDSVQEKCAIYASNYGEAGALDYYGKYYNLPKCISKGGSFWSWGYRDYLGDWLITVGARKSFVLQHYGAVDEGTPFYYPHARESGMPILIAYQQKRSLYKIWQLLKEYRW